jgi:hypothetical protein
MPVSRSTRDASSGLRKAEGSTSKKMGSLQLRWRSGLRKSIEGGGIASADRGRRNGARKRGRKVQKSFIVVVVVCPAEV